ncbi:MAG: arylsulfatase [Planctomycetaceae bacterium]|nr:arylsulfatase [Planctomycetaceae bacterium]
MYRIGMAVVLGSLLWPAMSVAEERPNIVVILCDDLGYGDLQCYGHPHIKTPNLDRLAAEGIRFTDCYSAAPVCSPSRVGLLTGRSPNRAGVYDWIPPARQQARPDAREQVHMRQQEIAFPQLLQRAGYRTCLAGKWHCNSQFNRPKQPQPGDFGFDHWLATQNNAAPSHRNPRNYVRNGEPVGEMEGYSCQLAVDEAVKWLEDSSKDDAPFFIFLPFHEPHEPVASPPELVANYETVARTENEAEYFANVENVDRAVGSLVAALDRLGKRDNTLIIFTSDNGPETLNRYRGSHRSYGQPGPLRGMKLHTHEAGFRVVGILNWPGEVEGKGTVSVPLSSLDFFPTFCQLANADIPESLNLDGQSFLPILYEGKLEREKPLVWAYYNAINQARVAMRSGRWKVLAKLEDVPKYENVTPQRLPRVRDAKLVDFEIYDLERDPAETKNLVGDNSAITEQLCRTLEQAYRELIQDSHVWVPADKQ